MLTDLEKLVFSLYCDRANLIDALEYTKGTLDKHKRKYVALRKFIRINLQHSGADLSPAADKYLQSLENKVNKITDEMNIQGMWKDTKI